jgi:hypothetical protein
MSLFDSAIFDSVIFDTDGVAPVEEPARGGRARRWVAEREYHRRRREEDEDEAWLVLQR